MLSDYRRARGPCIDSLYYTKFIEQKELEKWQGNKKKKQKKTEK